MKTFICLAFLCLSLFSFARPGKNSNGDYPSQGFTKKAGVPEVGTAVGFVGTDIRFKKDDAGNTSVNRQFTGYAWRGEMIHAQLIVRPEADIRKLRISVSELKDDHGNRIPAGQIKTGFLKFVMTDEFANGCGHRKPADFDSSLVADPIDQAVSSVSLAKGQVQPVWITIRIPETTKAGIYRGTITVKAGKKFRLPVTVEVSESILPSPDQWSFGLDFWQHPAAVARVHDVPLWSDEHFRLMRPYYTLLASAGQKNITTSIMHEPWNHQTYDDFPSLIKWTKKKDGSWQYDYTLFDKYVRFVMDCGISKQINCYSMVPWKTNFRYFDESLNRDTALDAAIGTPEYNAHWKTMLVDFTRHLKEKGWFSKTSIAMDERPMKAMQAVIGLLKEVDPAWKVALAGEYHPEIEKDIYEYCVASAWQFEPETLERRKREGKPSTFYTCCVEPYPNGFTFSPPDEHVWIGWYAAAKGFTGYLRWAYNSWVKNPVEDSRFKTWPAGDTYQVYPGPMTSIRFEKLIEGIQDYEKIRIIREKYSRNGMRDKLRELDEMLNTFMIEKLKTIPAAEMTSKAKALLRTL